MSGDSVRIAIIGSGKMASIHAANVTTTSGARLVSVAGGSGAAALAGRFGAQSMTVDEAFASDSVDAAIIASPNAFHADHTIAAAAAGKAVLVEKPVDLDLARADECLRAVGDAADRVVVAFNRRFDPSFAEVRRRVVTGEIGDVAQLVIVSRDPAPPPLAYVPGSGGLFRDMTIHDLDMARFLVGDITSVVAVGQSLDPHIAALGDYSGAMLTLTAASGAIITIVNSRSNSFGYDQRLEVFGPLGTLAVTNSSENLVVRSGGSSVDSASRVISHYGDRYRDAYHAEIEHLCAVARRETPSLSTLADGREALALAVAAGESARTGEVVRL